MSDLTDFLLARTGEDWDAARRAAAVTAHEWQGDHSVAIPREAALHMARHDPDRAMAEAVAKRRIVEAHAEDHKWCGDEVYLDPDFEGCRTLRHLAAVYADHPAYRAEWKP